MATTHTEKQPEPVLSVTTVVHVIAWLAAALAAFGLNDLADWATLHAIELAAPIVFVAPFVSAWLARRKVTPNDRPKANDGTPLVPVGTLAASNAAVDLALAKVKAIDAGVELADAQPDPTHQTPAA